MVHPVLGRAAVTAAAAATLFASAPALAAAGGTSLSGGPAAPNPCGTSVSGAPAASSHSSTSVSGAPAASSPGSTPATGAPAASSPGSTSSKHLGDRLLCPGMRGHDVRVLQRDLTIAGFATQISGIFGPVTKRHVIAFKRQQGLIANGAVTTRAAKVLLARVASIEADPPSTTTQINSDGTATAPAAAPAVVQEVVAAANRIIAKPYVYGGGHGSFSDFGYDCSGSVSYALHGGGLLSSPEDSVALESYGSAGAGHWITVYANAGHAFMVVAGRAFDTADYGGPNIPGGSGPRWRSNPTGNLADGGGYVVRHPTGL